MNVEHNDLNAAIAILDEWTQLQVQLRRLPGVAIGIVHDGQLLWGKGFGFADLEKRIPVDLDTRFRIASITKTFTAVAILQLRDQGKLRLDDPVSEYLDWFKLQFDGGQQITVRHLLTHTSGLPRDASVPHWTDGLFQSWEEVVSTTQERKPVLPPEQSFGYSNLGYALLGGIIEGISGEKWETYIQNHILTPLEMDNTIVMPNGDEPNLAKGYFQLNEQGERPVAPPAPTNGFAPSASLASSINDLVKYARFHLNPEQGSPLSRYTLNEMHNIHWLQKDWQGGYGYGTSSFRIGEWTISGHSGGYNGYLTLFTLCRNHNTAVIVLTNSIDSDPFPFVDRAYKLVLPEILKLAPKEMKAKPEWENFTGRYAGIWSDLQIVVRNNQLQAIPLRWIDAPPTILEPTDKEAEFKIKEIGGTEETARFETDESGKVVRLWLRNEYLLPKA
jgi:D-alanyl-D-alanine carboxypeptidase